MRYGDQFPSYGKPGCSNINLEARVLRDLKLLLNGSSSTEIFSEVDYKQIVANDKDTQEWYLAGLTSIINNNDWSAFEGEGYDRLLQQFRNNNDKYDFPPDPRFANFDTTKSLMH